MTGFAVGVDIGGTKIEAALIESSGREVRRERRPTPREHGAGMALIADLVRAVSGNAAPMGVGFSIPGSLDPATGLLRNAPNSPAIEGTPLARNLSRVIELPMAFENDANCLALSECRFGAARGYRNVVGLILGSGVGGGVIIDGKLFAGSSGLAPEPGHLPLDVNGRPCGCGNRGCAEAYLSGPSILNRYHEAGGDTSVVDTRTLFDRPGDAVAVAILTETDHLFCRFVAALVSLYDPELFVLGGGLSLQPRFIELAPHIAQFIFGSSKPPVLVQAQGGDASGKLGAASLIFDGRGHRPA